MDKMALAVGALVIAVIVIAAALSMRQSRKTRQTRKTADTYFVGGDAYLDLTAPGPQGSPYAMMECRD